jgi:hypothetical protein
LRVDDGGLVKGTLSDDTATRESEPALTRHDYAEADHMGRHLKRAARVKRIARTQQRIKRGLSTHRTCVVPLAGVVPHIGDDKALALGDASSAARESKRHLICIEGTSPRAGDAGNGNTPVV